jgi:lantibiotic biosynthesis protein
MTSDSDPFLEVSAELAQQIADSAIWYRGRCNWIGATGRERASAALGPDLYEGTSGVGLFLAEAAARFSDGRMRIAALGAIRHALRHAPFRGHGLYTGPIGIAYAAARIGRLLDAQESLAGACRLLRAWRRHRVPSPMSDVIAGRAGAVAGLVALSPLVEDSRLVAAATALGDELLADAEISDRGWSWTSPGQRSMHNLCGFAHGAAGIGLSLIELFGATGEERFRRAGQNAFAYERSWMEPGTGTWPDLRGVARAAPRDAPVPSVPYWCHGAPGIALSRMRAAEILGAEPPDAEVAVAATRRIVTALLAYTPVDFCLCHGAAGAADVLLCTREPGRLPVAVGLHGIERMRGCGTAIPCGRPEHETPGLMVGLAGAAMFYLRLGDPSVPSPLLIRPFSTVDRTSGSA